MSNAASSQHRPLRAPTPRAAAPRVTGPELWLLVGIGVLVASATLLPPLAQAQAYHRFADSRTLLGVPSALDVLSNLGFLAAGLWGLFLVGRDRLAFFSAALRLGAIVMFTGFALTAAGSAYYHLAPSDAGLVVDRLGMVVAFVGVLGMAAAQRVSDRAGLGLLALGLALGPCTVALWHAHGNLMPYAVMQYGGIALALALLLAPARGRGPNWAVLIAAYAFAKLLEGADSLVFELTQGLVSGHTLKHLVAALPVLAVTMALDLRRSAR